VLSGDSRGLGYYALPRSHRRRQHLEDSATSTGPAELEEDLAVGLGGSRILALADEADIEVSLSNRNPKVPIYPPRPTSASYSGIRLINQCGHINHNASSGIAMLSAA
jgi:hypothetical protein